MPILTQKKILNVIPGTSAQLTVHCSQNDTGSTVDFELYAGSEPFVPTGAASVQGVRKDGTGFGPIAVTLSGNVATVTLDSTMTGVEGPAVCELTKTEDDDTVSTANFALLVEAAAFPNGPLVDNSVDVYQQILSYVQGFPADAAADAAARVAAEAVIRADEDAALSDEITALRGAVGSPLVAATAAAMTDHDKVYVYTGSEAGMVAGDWYYWDGSDWVSGGVYNSAAVETDPTLSVPDMPADAAACGDLKSAILSVSATYETTAIPENADLNDYTTPGNYKVVTSAIAATILNAPATGSTYRLIVLQTSDSTHIAQIAITNNATNGGRLMLREKIDSTWTMWKRFAEEPELAALTTLIHSSVFDFDATKATAIAANTDLNSITTIGNYKVTSNATAATLTHCPVSVQFGLKVMYISTSSTTCQILIPNAASTGYLYYRLGATADWRRIEDNRNATTRKNVVLTSSNYATYWPNGSFNDAEPNTIYGINEDTVGLFSDGPVGNSVTGQPSDQSVPDSPPATMGKRRGTLLTLTQAQTPLSGTNNQSGLVQIFVGYRDSGYSPTIAYRTAIYSSGSYTWSVWSKFEEDGFLHAGNKIVYGGQPYIQNAPFTDLNDAPGNSIYHVDKNMDGSDADHTLAHHPTPGSSSIVITYSFSYTTPHARMQMVCSLAGEMFWRYGYLQATDDYRWTAWNRVAMDSGDIMRNKGRLANSSDLNDLTANAIYLLGGQSGAGYIHNPITSGAGYITIKSSNSIVFQCVEALGGTRYTRYSEDSGATWSEWQ